MVLLLFSPSIDLLVLLKTATGTVLDLPRIELGDGVPLIVHRSFRSCLPIYSILNSRDVIRFTGRDHFHFVPGFLQSQPEVNSLSVPEDAEELSKIPDVQDSTESMVASSYSSAIQYSVELLGRCLSERESSVEAKLTTSDTLDPPTGTSFVSRQVVIDVFISLCSIFLVPR